RGGRARPAPPPATAASWPTSARRRSGSGASPRPSRVVLVADAMTRRPVTVAPDAPVAAARGACVGGRAGARPAPAGGAVGGGGGPRGPPFARGQVRPADPRLAGRAG